MMPVATTPPRAEPDWCLFLDFDGTLIEIGERPDSVHVPSEVGRLLARLLDAFGGAVAILSGRTVVDIERRLAPPRLPVGGLHGLQRRDANGILHQDAAASEALDTVRAAIADFVATHEGLLLEDKGATLAVHYREAPACGAAVAAFLEARRAALGTGFELQPGKALFELKPVGSDKGGAVEAFLAEPPFAGRRPVCVGDDRTDEDAFAAANRMGGVSVRVGSPETPTSARYRLDSVTAARAWLDSLPAGFEG